MTDAELELRQAAERVRQHERLAGAITLRDLEFVSNPIKAALIDLAHAYLAEHPADAPRIGNADEALQRLRDAGGDGWDKIDDPEEYLGRRDRPPLTRERVEKAVEGLFGGEFGDRLRITNSKDWTLNYGGWHREDVVDHLCRLLGVEE